MRPLKTPDFVSFGTYFFLLEMLLPRYAAAYVDPGTTGMLSQILYVLFYSALGAFFYCLRYLKKYLAGIKEFLAKCFDRKS